MKKYRLLLFAAAGLALGSCSKDGIEDQPGGKGTDEIKFEIGFAPDTRVATDAAFNSTWETGDQIGIFAVQHANGGTGTLAASGNFIHNVKLTYDGTDWATDAGVNLYYPAGSDQLDFYAYYPYNATATDPTNITFNVKADQSAAANYSTSDLMSASVTDVAKSANPVNLVFAHKLALVEVAIDPAYIDRNGNFTATLLNCKSGGTFNLGSGTLTPSGTTQAIKMMRVETDPVTATANIYRALVPAQTVAQGSNLCLMSQNEQLYNTPALTTALPLTAGAAKRYTSALPATALATVKINNGTFIMGSSDGTNIGNGNGSGLNTTSTETARNSDETQHSVTLTKDFYMSKYQITKAQYTAFLNAADVGSDRILDVTGYGPQVLFTESDYDWTPRWNSVTSQWDVTKSGGEQHPGDVPTINVTWFGAKAYAEWVGGNLPTEAQWEYACRAGTITAYSFGDDATIIGDYAWCGDAPLTGPGLVGTKRSNPWGLYDMHGNVYEWCSDWYKNDYYSDPSARTDPTGPATAQSSRVLRGGSWLYSARVCRSAYRYNIGPGLPSILVGFRVVFVQ